MITRYACLPRSITRRGFNAFMGSAIGREFLSRKLSAAGSPFTIALVPDPQWLCGDASSDGNGSCGGTGAYAALIQWAITNRNLLVNGVSLNTKGFLSVGDCNNFISATQSTVHAQQDRTIAAWCLADGVGGSATASPKMFVARCSGNHDFPSGGSVIVRGNLAFMYRDDQSGAWSPTTVSAAYSGGMDLGSGDVASYGGTYPDPTFPVSTANHYMLLNIQGMNIGILVLEFCPRASVLQWAQTIQQTFGNYQWWISTHCYQDTTGAVISRASAFGPNHYSLGDAGASNSGLQIWGGGAADGGGGDLTWGGVKTWPNLTGMFCGHWIDGTITGWVWQRNPATSASGRGQTVQQIFCNQQESDNTSTCHNGAADCAHLMLLRITPATQMMEAFMVSTNSGLYTGATSVINSASPIQLFNVPMQSPGSSSWSGSISISGNVILQ